MAKTVKKVEKSVEEEEVKNVVAETASKEVEGSENEIKLAEEVETKEEKGTASSISVVDAEVVSEIGNGEEYRIYDGPEPAKEKVIQATKLSLEDNKKLEEYLSGFKDTDRIIQESRGGNFVSVNTREVYVPLSLFK